MTGRFSATSIRTVSTAACTAGAGGRAGVPGKTEVHQGGYPGPVLHHSWVHHRTLLSWHRTLLSWHRTLLSWHRTLLSPRGFYDLEASMTARLLLTARLHLTREASSDREASSQASRRLPGFQEVPRGVPEVLFRVILRVLLVVSQNPEYSSPPLKPVRFRPDSVTFPVIPAPAG